MNSQYVIKIIFAVLLFLCLEKMLYSSYQLVGYAGLIGFTLLVYPIKGKGRETEMIIYCGLALLFQPFLKVAHCRQV